jgi:hypothetical protein
MLHNRDISSVAPTIERFSLEFNCDLMDIHLTHVKFFGQFHLAVVSERVFHRADCFFDFIAGEDFCLCSGITYWFQILSAKPTHNSLCLDGLGAIWAKLGVGLFGAQKVEPLAKVFFRRLRV